MRAPSPLVNPAHQPHTLLERIKGRGLTVAKGLRTVFPDWAFGRATDAQEISGHLGPNKKNRKHPCWGVAVVFGPVLKKKAKSQLLSSCESNVLISGSSQEAVVYVVLPESVGRLPKTKDLFLSFFALCFFHSTAPLLKSQTISFG